MTSTLLDDRLDLLRELACIEHDVAVFEDQHGATADTRDVRRRVTTARDVVLDQLCHGAQLDRAETRH